MKEVDATQMVIAWTKPASYDFLKAQYAMKMKEPTSTRWIQVHKEDTKDLIPKAKGSLEGKEYEFQCDTPNDAGQGPFSKSSEPRLAEQPSGKTSEFVIFVIGVILCWFCRL